MSFVRACLKYGLKAGQLLSRPCQGVLAQRAERSMQLWCLYSKLYDRHSARRVLNKLGSSIHSKVAPRSRRLILLLSASAPLLKLDKSAILQENNIDDFLITAVSNLTGKQCSGDLCILRDVINGRLSTICDIQEKESADNKRLGWEMFIDSESVSVFRRQVSDRPSHLCEYLVCGSYSDIHPAAFHDAQNDIDYRRQWDSYTMELQLLKSDTQSKTEFIRWIVSFPFPLAPREYVLRRQAKVDLEKNMIIAVNRAIPPELERDAEINNEKNRQITNKRIVRVSEYYSVMVVIPHKSLEEPGLDFFLLYFDDPQTPSGHFASYAQSVGAGASMRDYLMRLRKAALCLQSNPNRQRLVTMSQQCHQPSSSSSEKSSPVESVLPEISVSA